MLKRIGPGLALAAAVSVLAADRPGAQTDSRGQNASPAYEGWEKNADGSSTSSSAT